MTSKTITLLTAIVFSSWVNIAIGEETSIILIEMEIYNLNKTQKNENGANTSETQQPLQVAKLESSPRLMIELGKEATIEIATQTADGKDEDMFRLLLNSNALENNYDIDIGLTNKGAERVTSIADLAFNNTFALSTSINIFYPLLAMLLSW